MKLSRRNALIGIGTIVAGSGALVGSGAFTTVQADRTVNVSAAGDGSAQLGIDITGDLAGSNGDTIQFDLGGNGVNLDATTEFADVLTITNNGTNAVNVDIEDGSGNSMVADTYANTGTSTDMAFLVNTAGDQDGVASSGGSVTLDVYFDLTGTTAAGNENIPSTVTITATDST